MNRCGATVPGANQVCTTWSMPRRRPSRDRERVDHLGFGPEVALEGEGGDAELVEAVEQPVGERAGPGDDRAAAGDRSHVRRERALPASAVGRSERMRTTVTCQMSMMAPPSAIRVWPVM